MIIVEYTMTISKVQVRSIILFNISLEIYGSHCSNYMAHFPIISTCIHKYGTTKCAWNTNGKFKTR